MVPALDLSTEGAVVLGKKAIAPGGRSEAAVGRRERPPAAALTSSHGGLLWPAAARASYEDNDYLMATVARLWGRLNGIFASPTSLSGGRLGRSTLREWVGDRERSWGSDRGRHRAPASHSCGRGECGCGRRNQWGLGSGGSVGSGTAAGSQATHTSSSQAPQQYT